MIIPATAVVGQPIEFISDATAYDGTTITNYLWDFGEGVPVTTRDATYSYTKPGTYKVMLTVWDSNLRGHLCEKEIVVSPSPTQAAGVDVRELERIIALAETMLAQNPGYPEYNKNRLSAAIAEAAGYLTSVNQSEVDGICEYLFTEIVNFEKKVMNKSELEELLLAAKAVDQNDYTAGSVKALLEAIALGESVLFNGAATESDLAAAIETLTQALGGLTTATLSCTVKSMLAKIGKLQAIPYTWNGYGSLEFWTSNAAVCNVTPDGRLIPMKAGIAVIKITPPNGLMVIFTVSVSA